MRTVRESEAIARRIAGTREFIAGALARRAVVLAERELVEAEAEPVYDDRVVAVGKARARLREAQDRVEREGA